MKWFTREWHERGMNDPRAASVWDEYSRHLSDILFDLVNGVDALVSSVHIAGALVDSYSYKDGVLTLEMFTGDDTNGYEWLTLKYIHVVEMDPPPEQYGFLVQKGTEILHDEVDIVDDLYEHRFLCWPSGEVRIAFYELEVERRPGTADERLTFE